MNTSSNMIIFIVGNPRSGTNLMKSAIENHSAVYGFGELHFFDSLWDLNDNNRKISVLEATDLVARLLCSHHDGFLRQGDHRRFYSQAQAILQAIKQERFFPIDLYTAFLKYIGGKYGKSIPCDRTPQYAYYITEILQLLPETKIIVMIRDPRDILLSRKNKWKFRFLRQEKTPLQETIRAWINYHPVFSSQFWNTAIAKSARYRHHKRVCFVRFEDVLQYPEKEIRNVCEFLDLSYHSCMLNVSMGRSSLIADDPDRAGIDQTRTGKWRHGGLNSAEIFINQLINSKLMKQFGYEPVKVFPNPFLLLFYLLTCPFKLGLTFLFHKKYLKNVQDTIRRRLL